MTDETPDRIARLGVLLSGSGRTLQNLLDRSAEGRLAGEVVCVLSDRDSAFGLERARAAQIPAVCAQEADAVWTTLREYRVDIVCLAGYLRLLPIPDDFADGRVLNIHPSLLPAHGGKGMYGDRVHRAVLDAKDIQSGCTVHACDNAYDTGPVVVQRSVPVIHGDTVETLAARVFDEECEAFPAAINITSRRLGFHVPPDCRA